MLIEKLEEEGFDFSLLPSDLRESCGLIANAQGEEGEKMEVLDEVIFDAIQKLFPDNTIVKKIAADEKKEESAINNDGFNTQIEDGEVVPNEQKTKFISKEINMQEKENKDDSTHVKINEETASQADYSPAVGDIDKDKIPNADDPNPTKKGDKNSIEETRLADAVKKIINVKGDLDKIMNEFVPKLTEHAPHGSLIYARTKSPYSIINKLVDKKLIVEGNPKEGLTDLIGTTIAVKDYNDLEQIRQKLSSGALGEVFEEEDMYVAPKNGYKAIHYILLIPSDSGKIPVEVQLKTIRMKEINKLSHDAYKSKNLNSARMLELTALADKADKGDKRAEHEYAEIMQDKEAVKKSLYGNKMAQGGIASTTSAEAIKTAQDTLVPNGGFHHFDFIKAATGTPEHFPAEWGVMSILTKAGAELHLTKYPRSLEIIYKGRTFFINDNGGEFNIYADTFKDRFDNVPSDLTAGKVGSLILAVLDNYLEDAPDLEGFDFVQAYNAAKAQIPEGYVFDFSKPTLLEETIKSLLKGGGASHLMKAGFPNGIYFSYRGKRFLLFDNQDGSFKLDCTHPARFIIQSKFGILTLQYIVNSILFNADRFVEEKIEGIPIENPIDEGQDATGDYPANDIKEDGISNALRQKLWEATFHLKNSDTKKLSGGGGLGDKERKSYWVGLDALNYPFACNGVTDTKERVTSLLLSVAGGRATRDTLKMVEGQLEWLNGKVVGVKTIDGVVIPAEAGRKNDIAIYGDRIVFPDVDRYGDFTVTYARTAEAFVTKEYLHKNFTSYVEADDYARNLREDYPFVSLTDNDDSGEYSTKYYAAGGAIHTTLYDDEELVFHAGTKGGKYTIDVVKKKNEHGEYFDTSEYTSGEISGMGTVRTPEELKMWLTRQLKYGREGGINYLVTVDKLGIDTYENGGNISVKHRPQKGIYEGSELDKIHHKYFHKIRYPELKFAELVETNQIAPESMQDIPAQYRFSAANGVNYEILKPQPLKAIGYLEIKGVRGGGEQIFEANNWDKEHGAEFRVGSNFEPQYVFDEASKKLLQNPLFWSKPAKKIFAKTLLLMGDDETWESGERLAFQSITINPEKSWHTDYGLNKWEEYQRELDKNFKPEYFAAGGKAGQTLESYLRTIQHFRIPRLTKWSKQSDYLVMMMEVIDSVPELLEVFKRVATSSVDGFLSRSFNADKEIKELVTGITSKIIFWEKVKEKSPRDFDAFSLSDIPESVQITGAKIILAGILGEFEVSNSSLNKYLTNENLKTEISNVSVARGKQKLGVMLENQGYEQGGDIKEKKNLVKEFLKKYPTETIIKMYRDNHLYGKEFDAAKKIAGIRDIEIVVYEGEYQINFWGFGEDELIEFYKENKSKFGSRSESEKEGKFAKGGNVYSVADKKRLKEIHDTLLEHGRTLSVVADNPNASFAEGEFERMKNEGKELREEEAMILAKYNKPQTNIDEGFTNLLATRYKNPYELNRAIETLLDKKNSTDPKDYTSDEKRFISLYSGMGGLEKFGAKGAGLLYEYFTPETITQKMWGLAYKHGFNGGDVCEPSSGVGAFIKYANENCNVTGFEINKYSYMICKILFPNAQIYHSAFEQRFIRNNNTVRDKVFGDNDIKTPSIKFDLVIGNPPYGTFNSRWAGMGEQKFTRANTYVEYFITRGLDLLKPDGLLIYIIGVEVANGGTPFLQQQMTKAKEEIMEKAELLEAYRLPNGVFERTDVVSDILVLRKK